MVVPPPSGKDAAAATRPTRTRGAAARHGNDGVGRAAPEVGGEEEELGRPGTETTAAGARGTAPRSREKKDLVVPPPSDEDAAATTRLTHTRSAAARHGNVKGEDELGRAAAVRRGRGGDDETHVHAARGREKENCGGAETRIVPALAHL